MRQLTCKYAGECAKCHAALEVGAPAMYEKRTGIFCVGCEPKEVEEIRSFREDKAERKASRYDEWADKREAKGNNLLEKKHAYESDWAFITQPGHIPARAEMHKRMDRGFEQLKKADEMRGRAFGIRANVCVKGDRERSREAEREFTRKWIAVGMRVTDSMYGAGIVTRVNKKTASVKHDRCNGAFPICLSWLAPEDKNAESFRAAIEAYKAEKQTSQVPA